MPTLTDAPEATIKLTDQVMRDYFPYLVNAKIKVIFADGPRKTRGGFVLGSIQPSNAINRVLSREEARDPTGFDYIMILDKTLFEAIEEADRIRIIRHELRHCFYDLDAKGNPYKTVGHEIEDFYDEVELNKDDPRWRERMAAIAASVHDRE